MRILLTGGAGFIGSNLADALIADGHHLAILDNLSTGRVENVPSEAEFIELDILSSKVEDVIRQGRFDALFHYAAQIEVRTSVADPLTDVRVNVAGSVALLEFAKRYGIPRFYFASTGGVIYGEQDYFPADENHPLRPQSPYAVAKASVEKYMYYYWKVFGITAIALRYGNVFGPRQNPFGEAGVIAIFCRRMLDRKTAFINGDGLTTRDYVYISDVVRANLAAIQLDGFHIFNIGTGIETDVLTIYDALNRLTGAAAPRNHKPAPPGEQRRSCIDSGLAKRVMEWKPEVSFDDGLKRTVDYFKTRTR